MYDYVHGENHFMVQDNSTVLIHGNSRVVSALILKAAESKQFNVIVTEGKPTCDGSGSHYLLRIYGFFQMSIVCTTVSVIYFIVWKLADS